MSVNRFQIEHTRMGFPLEVKEYSLDDLGRPLSEILTPAQTRSYQSTFDVVLRSSDGGDLHLTEGEARRLTLGEALRKMGTGGEIEGRTYQAGTTRPSLGARREGR